MQWVDEMVGSVKHVFFISDISLLLIFMLLHMLANNGIDYADHVHQKVFWVVIVKCITKLEDGMTAQGNL